MRVSAISAIGLLALAACMPANASAQSAAQPYHGLGTEPFWSVTLDGQTIHYEPANGPAVSVPSPRPIVGFNGERYETRRLTVDITHVKCSDGMSDRIYHDTVVLTVDGKTLRGCGGETATSPATAPSTLLEGAWSIQSIAGRRPVAGTRPDVRFQGTRISGSTGCNSFGGAFRFDRGHLTTGPLITTRRACARPANAQEQNVLKLLGQRLSVSRNRAGKLVMTGHGQTLVLVRTGGR
ncbi:META domain-containing protein [Sphingomonas sp. JC676]|uniref:META domain-containing protein n=1 Tax=Sphingomonas sp. JC676 TaxID=2768065 RepID=UPI0016580024|nr:META domain-containing protein [Sphingomonas sp. JC676]MBC9031478.1 META domain-containing protein [Sphingomonas sp. JC676]